MTYTESAEQFISALADLQARYDANDAEVGIKDKESLDLEHAIEFSTDRNELRRLATQLKRVRTERRKAKDFASSYSAAVAYIRANKGIMDKLTTLLGLLRKAEENKHRVYIPRIREDLFYCDGKKESHVEMP